jgi:hypothetical protein
MDIAAGPAADRGHGAMTVTDHTTVIEVVTGAARGIATAIRRERATAGGTATTGAEETAVTATARASAIATASETEIEIPTTAVGLQMKQHVRNRTRATVASLRRR